MSKKNPIEAKLTKCPTGIQGLNEITDGGLPKGRPTVLRGTAEFKVMPLSAIEACEVDCVLPTINLKKTITEDCYTKKEYATHQIM